MRFDVNFLRRQIEALKAAYPELAEDETLLADVLEGETELNDILSFLVRQANETEAISDGLGEYAKALAARRARLERRVQSIRALMMSAMDAAGIKKATLPEATLSISAGRPRLVIDDEAMLPPAYVLTVTQPNKDAIKEALAANLDVPGAHMSNSEPSIRVRVL